MIHAKSCADRKEKEPRSHPSTMMPKSQSLHPSLKEHLNIIIISSYHHM